MKLVVVAAVLVVLLACLSGLESAPSAPSDVVVSEAVARQVKRELETFERALLADEDTSYRNKRGFWKKLKKGLKKAVTNYAIGKAVGAVLSGKRDLADFSE